MSTIATIVEYYGDQSNSKCGYCKKGGSQSTGMWAHSMSPDDYQDLIDRGWRRSGCYLYKPNMQKTCCPSYTIKTDAIDFKLNKSHKKVIKKMNKFLKDGLKDNTCDASNSDGGMDTDVGMAEFPNAPNVPRSLINLKEIKCMDANLLKLKSENAAKDEPPSRKAEQNPLQSGEPVPKVDVPTKGPDPNKPACKKAKTLRLERRREKLAAQGLPDLPTASKNVEKTLEDFLNEAPTENCAHKLKVILLPSKNTTCTIDEVFNLYRKYQIQVHNDPPTKPCRSSFERFLCKSPLKIELLLVNSEEYNSTKKWEFALYKKYQTTIHNDIPTSISEFIDFLVESPLKPYKNSGGPPKGYGSFHQQYWLDNKLIAVAVIDILPSCISSVYFFYDPEYRFLSLGTYGSLREIAFTRELHQKCPALSQYYMGYYIHSCPKMRYKGKLSGSYLLCPEVYTWHLLNDAIIAKLDASKYQRLNDDKTARDANLPTIGDIDSVLIFCDRQCMRYEIYKELTTDDFDEVFEYAKLVGRKSMQKMLLYRHV